MRKFLMVTLCMVALITTAERAVAQSAVFSGTVLVDPSEKPLANAEIVFTALNRAVRSDSAGNFSVIGLPAGKHQVTVRMLGYDPLTMDITLTSEQKIDADLMLRASTPMLKTVAVKDKAESPYASRLMEFDERKKTGIGRFIDGEIFAKEDGRPVSSIITQRISGVKMIQVNGRKWMADNRGGEVRLNGQTSGPCGSGQTVTCRDLPKACYTQVIVNGVVRYNGSSGQNLFDVDELDAKDIIGFEYHTVATVPSQYNSTQSKSNCGTVIFWTKTY